MKIGTTLQSPLILLVFISFGASIYAWFNGLIELTTVIFLGVIITLYIIGLILNNRKKYKIKEGKEI